jgi:hypothetical protein
MEAKGEKNQMKIMMLVLMIPIELFLIAANWIVAIINPSLGKRFVEWNIRTLPNKEWYFKK